MSESVTVIRLSGYPRSILVRLALKCKILVLNFFSEKSKCFALDKVLLFDP